MHLGSRLATNAIAIVIGLALATASGCAATQRDARRSTSSAETSSEAYIQAVNQRAFRRGYLVRWVHPPGDD